MKAILYAVMFAFAMDNFWASAQQYTSHACKNGLVLLSCRTGLIQVLDVVLGDSRCWGRSCCPRQNDCSGQPSPSYRNQVDSFCNGRQSCSRDVEIRNIGCGAFPSNDYVNITYKCIAIETSTVPSTSFHSSTTRFLSSLSSSTALHWGHISSSTTWGRSALSSSTHSSTSPPPDYKATGHPQKPEKKTPEYGEPKEAAVQAQKDQGNDYGYPDRITLLLSLAVVVGGVVITVTVVSVAVVLVSKKRRMVKTEESYDIPNYSCSANNDNENARNSNFYDFIPDSGNCPGSQSANFDCAGKENDYLTPVHESEEAPYLWIP